LFVQSRIDFIAIGKAIPDFTLVYERLEEFQFSSLLGKAQVIDVWTTCCKIGIYLRTGLEKGKDEMQEDKIVFFINIDYVQDRWINYAEDHHVNYDRYWIGKGHENTIIRVTFGQVEYEGQELWAESIPSFVVINKNSKAEALDFVRPGLSSFRKAIKKALKN